MFRPFPRVVHAGKDFEMNRREELSLMKCFKFFNAFRWSVHVLYTRFFKGLLSFLSCKYNELVKVYRV